MPESAPSSGLRPVVLVTGGAQGIGDGIAIDLRDHGYSVVVADIDAEAGAECAADGHDFVPTNMAEESQVAACLERTLKLHGRLDVLVNNAGIADPVGGPI